MKNKNIFYHIRQRIRDPITNKVISQEQFAKFLGYDKSTVCMNEKKEHKPSLEYAYAISRASGVSLDYIAKKLLGAYLPDPEIKKYLDAERIRKLQKNFLITYIKRRQAQSHAINMDI